ncbi:hypothetical protein SprV_0501766000 [Sparganum proliferum]
MKTFRIQHDNREEVVSVNRPEAAVSDTPPDETCGPLPSASPPAASIPPSCISPLSSCPLPLTVTGNSNTSAVRCIRSSTDPVYIIRSGRHVHFPDRTFIAITVAAITTPVAVTSITDAHSLAVPPPIPQAVTTTPPTLATSDYSPDDPSTTTSTTTVHTNSNMDSTPACPQCAHTFISRIGLVGLLIIHCTETDE